MANKESLLSARHKSSQAACGFKRMEVRAPSLNLVVAGPPNKTTLQAREARSLTFIRSSNTLSRSLMRTSCASNLSCKLAASPLIKAWKGCL